MIVSLSDKKPLNLPIFSPLDFYRFRHSTELVQSSGEKLAIQRPLWIVGVSPFDPVHSGDGGYVVHLGNPQFVARWTMEDETIEQVQTRDYFDEDLNILLYEVSHGAGVSDIPDDWLMEAVQAVAYTKGLVAIMTPEDTQ